CARKQEDLDYW
nr:immunoglobulin heavy chain junction region [Macaca mulatta]MOV59750.1 immunoglobulin heavy chain junction region [Macaca mulatta]MOV59994.1 immunoglobulin heavy chain junction region [Macaca mulatta]